MRSRPAEAGAHWGYRVEFTLQAAFSPAAFIGHSVYILMVIGMMMRKMILLRLFAIASSVAGICYSGFILTDPVSTGWEFVLVSVNVFQLTLLWWLDRKTQFDEREAALRAAHFATLSPSKFKKLLKAGRWGVAAPGDRLATEGQAVPALSYIAAGTARILVSGRTVAISGPGAFIGEMTVAAGSPATATVIVEEPAEIWSIDGEALRRLSVRQPDVRRALDAAFFEILRSRIVDRNRRDAAADLATSAA